MLGRGAGGKTEMVLRIVRFLISVALFLGFVWFGATVDLGERSLFGHLYAIGRTKESQDLVKGTKDKAQPLVEDVRRRLATAPDGGMPAARPSPATSPAPSAAPPAEAITDADRKQLRRVIGAARQASK